MKATEFVKKYGWDYAIKFLNYEECIAGNVCELDFDESDNLLELVNAYELVESYGGLASARKEAHKDPFESNPLRGCCYLVASVDA